MLLEVNGKKIKDVAFDPSVTGNPSTVINEVYCDGTLVWQRWTPPGWKMFGPGYHRFVVPSVKPGQSISICGVGAGGGGAFKNDDSGPRGYALGGMAGAAHFAKYDLTEGDIIELSVGSGGSSNSKGQGGKGGTTTIKVNGHVITLNGGAGGQTSDWNDNAFDALIKHNPQTGWPGNGGFRDGSTQCSGDRGCGGQASRLNSGGRGSCWCGIAQGGGYGAGGGGGIGERCNSHSGSGGHGVVYIGWNGGVVPTLKAQSKFGPELSPATNYLSVDDDGYGATYVLTYHAKNLPIKNGVIVIKGTKYVQARDSSKLFQIGSKISSNYYGGTYKIKEQIG